MKPRDPATATGLRDGIIAHEAADYLLGAAGSVRLNGGGMSPPPQTTSWLDALSGYPDWLVAAGLTVVAVAAIWLLSKLLKWGLYLLMVLVLAGGAIATVWLLFE